MKATLNIIIVIFLGFIAGSSFAQDYNKTDDQGRKQGKYTIPNLLQLNFITAISLHWRYVGVIVFKDTVYYYYMWMLLFLYNVNKFLVNSYFCA